VTSSFVLIVEGGAMTARVSGTRRAAFLKA
jgi:hypothetical protein